MSKNKLVSVLIPCYNCEKTIKDSLLSIVYQSYKNLEIICIDDGSTDSTWNVLKKIAYTDPRIKLLRNEENLGLIDTLNRGLDFASGDYIARMDSDDLSVENRIQEEILYLENNQLDICGSFMFLMNDNNQIFGKRSYSYSLDFLFCYSLFDSPLFHPTVLSKSEIMKKMRYLKSDETYVIEDYDLWCRALENNINIGICPQYLLKYRYNESGESFTKRTTQKMNFINRSLKYQKSVGLDFFNIYTTAILCGVMLDNRDYFNDLHNSIKQLEKIESIIRCKAEFQNWKHKKILWSIYTILKSDFNIKNILSSIKILKNLNLFYSTIVMLSYIKQYLKRKCYA